LQDQGRAVVVGERSYGKGTVQHVIDIEGGRAILKLTAASYHRPSGENIHRRKGATPDEVWGVRPDAGFDVPLDEFQVRDLRESRMLRDAFHDVETADGGTGAPPEPSSDPQLDRAIEHLRGRLRDEGRRPQAA
jgi:carboxyl-terminal processing protease